MLDLPKGSPNKCLRPPRGNKLPREEFGIPKNASKQLFLLGPDYCEFHRGGKPNICSIWISKVLDQCSYHLEQQPRQQSLRAHTLKPPFTPLPCPHIQFLNLEISHVLKAPVAPSHSISCIQSLLAWVCNVVVASWLSPPMLSSAMVTSSPSHSCSHSSRGSPSTQA